MWKVIAISNDLSLVTPGKSSYFAVLSNGKKQHRLPIDADIAVEIATDKDSKPSVEELERILEGDEQAVVVQSNGSLEVRPKKPIVFETEKPEPTIDQDIDQLVKESQEEERLLPGLRPTTMNDLDDVELPPDQLEEASDTPGARSL